MGTASTTQIEQRNVTHRILWFLGWFGVIYGILSIVQVVQWRSLIRWDFTRFRQIPQFYCRAIIELSSIWLILGCIGLLRSRPGARRILFAWALFVLALEMIAAGSIIQQNVSTMSDYLPALLSQLVNTVPTMGFPLMVVCVMTLRDAAHAGGGFEVVTKDGPIGDGSAAVVVPPGAFCRDVLRWMAWVGLLMGLLGSFQMALYGYGYEGAARSQWPDSRSQWRAMAIAAVRGTQAASHILLLGGALLVVFRQRSGYRMVVHWAMLFLAMGVAGFVLYDIPYIYWQATRGPARQYRFMTLEAAYRFFLALRTSAFAIIALYLLWQPEIEVQQAPEPPTRSLAELGRTTKPVSDG